MVEGQDIGAFRKFHDDRVFGTVGTVIFRKLYAQTSCLDAHHRVQLRVKVSRTTEDLRRNLVLLNRSSGVIQYMLGEIAQQFAQRLGAVQDVAVHQLVDLTEILLSFRQRTPRDNRLKEV